MTHTYTELEVSRAVYDEIAAKLREAGYDHAFMRESSMTEPTIDMHGIGLVLEGTHVAEQKTAAPLTDDMMIEINLQLLQDLHAPKVEALAFEREGETQRITNIKGTGIWNVTREFRCRFTIKDLRALARSITHAGEKPHAADMAERPGADAGDSGTAGGPERTPE